ncbi:unnamed protein product [Meganyctiphanes norvegica]|uniref:C2H2-type domain-containing protein n=1 Tax=Meganyctiphanes norvegica TaxID=48144 RepID=A0AAV2PW16_MEGNR
MDPLKVIKHEMDGSWDNSNVYAEPKIEEHSIKIEPNQDTELGEIVHNHTIQPKSIKQEKCAAEKGLDNQRVMKEKGEKTYHCRHCDEQISCENAVKHYQKMHSPHRYSDSENSLKRNMRTHTGEKPHQCSHCDKCYAYTGALNKHLMTHTGEKPYQCSHCDKCYAYKGALNKHLMTHTGEKPYKCRQCEMSFASITKLKSHKNSH